MRVLNFEEEGPEEENEGEEGLVDPEEQEYQSFMEVMANNQKKNSQVYW